MVEFATIVDNNSSTLPDPATTDRVTPGDGAASKRQDESTTEKAILMLVLIIIDLLSIIGNLSLWAIIVGVRSLRTITNYLVLCLSVADLVISFVNAPSVGYLILSGDDFLPKTACVVLGFINMLTFIFSVMALGLISGHRYILICYPQICQKLFTNSNLIWMFVGECKTSDKNFLNRYF